jgi:hypothetical protein
MGEGREVREHLGGLISTVIPGPAAGRNPESSSYRGKAWIPGSVLRTAPE